jgi:hypothetical protein
MRSRISFGPTVGQSDLRSESVGAFERRAIAAERVREVMLSHAIRAMAWCPTASHAYAGGAMN